MCVCVYPCILALKEIEIKCLCVCVCKLGSETVALLVSCTLIHLNAHVELCGKWLLSENAR